MNKIEMSSEDALEQVKNSFIFDNYIVGDMGPWFIAFLLMIANRLPRLLLKLLATP